MLDKKLSDYDIILGSASPRREELFATLNLPFSIKITDVEDTHPIKILPHQKAKQTAQTLAMLKARSYTIENNTMVITADTVVSLHGQILGKPRDQKEAIEMLQQLSKKKHVVITAVCIKDRDKEVVFYDKTIVKFAKLTDEEITYYVDNFNPIDKAGAYGIQEWIGKIGIKYIKGSYYNVMGLPIHQLYKTLKKW